MYRLPGGRRPLQITEGPYTGASCVVQDLNADPIRQRAIGLVMAFYEAKGWAAEQSVLTDLYGLFLAEAEPTWDIADHHGRIPASGAGMWRLPVALALGFIEQWITPLTSAVDEMVPPGPLRDALNQGLRAAAPQE